MKNTIHEKIDLAEIYTATGCLLPEKAIVVNALMTRINIVHRDQWEINFRTDILGDQLPRQQLTVTRKNSRERCITHRETTMVLQLEKKDVIL